MNRKFKIGDIVTCPHSEEIEQPMVVDGYNLWYSDLNVYYVKGKHRKKGNELIITFSENELIKCDAPLV